MRKSISFISFCLLIGSSAALAQSYLEEYQKFRTQVLSDYDNFKSRILEHYADFLNGEWHEFEPLWEEESPYTEPKPAALPETSAEPEAAPAPAVAQLPAPRFADSALGGVLAAAPGGGLAQGSITGFDMPSMKIDVPGGMAPANVGTKAMTPGEASLLKSKISGKTSYDLAVLRLPDPGFAFGRYPGQTLAPNPGESGIVNIDLPARRMNPEDLARSVEGSGYATPETFREPENQTNFKFEYYGMEAFVPEIDFKIDAFLAGPEQTGAHWSRMAAQEGGVETSRQLFGLAQQLGLNGYLTFRLAEAYVNQRFPASDSGARMSAVHFLLSQMGYDVRLISLDGVMTCMMPFDQKVVYATLSQTIDGRKYTILYPEGWQPEKGKAMRVLTCQLPKESLGKTSDLRLTGLSLPMKAKDFELTNGTLSLKGQVNENLQKILHHYPQMPTGDFASSWADQTLRQSLVDQLRTQLSGMEPRQQVNSLMALCHKGFAYSTDQEFHGFEKPYFLEENFLYPKNDCEDRAIFFSYMLWNALGLPCQLVQYPGHESATVALAENIDGYYYDTEGVRYYSSDPTYIGSSVGMVMKAFRSASPTVDKHYR